MSDDVSNALQGKLSRRNGQLKEKGESQLDLFSSLADQASASSRIRGAEMASVREPQRPLFPPEEAPPDVAREVRMVFSTPEEEDAAQRDTVLTPREGRPPLVTGIYHRPRRPLEMPLPPEPLEEMPGKDEAGTFSFRRMVSDWFAGTELDRRTVALVLVAIVLVAMVAFWTACPRTVTTEEGDVAASAVVSPAEQETVTEAAGSGDVAGAAVTGAEGVAVAPVEPKPVPVAVFAPLPSIAGAQVTAEADGRWFIRYEESVFVSTDRISPAGMKALKATAVRLAGLTGGARVTVTGHTDDVPLSQPTERFRDNADIAAARAKAAADHLRAFSRANKGLVFEEATAPADRAPYPNDSSAHRRLNRTVTLLVGPPTGALP